MGVTSGIIDDFEMGLLLDRLAALIFPDGSLILKDTLSTAEQKTIEQPDGYVARYRNVVDYVSAVTRRGFKQAQCVELGRRDESNLVNNLYLFSRKPVPHEL